MAAEKALAEKRRSRKLAVNVNTLLFTSIVRKIKEIGVSKTTQKEKEMKSEGEFGH